MNLWEVTLTADDVEQCRVNAKRIESQHGGATSDSYTGVNVAHGDFVGNCGELAFSKWCKEFNIKHTWVGSSSKEAEVTDFMVQLDHGPAINVDVKNSHHERAAFLMVPHAQFQKYDHDAYIGCTGTEVGDQVVVVIHGIVSRRVLKAKGVIRDLHCLTVQYPLNLLTRLDPHMFQRVAA